MYKFNFLNRINQEKLETKKRNRFISLIFISSTSCIVLILGILYLYSMNIGSKYNEALELGKKLQDETSAFRKKEFFSYRNIQNTYNSVMKRKKLSSIFEAFESSVDSTIIINNLFFEQKMLKIGFVIRNNESKSQLMTIANNLKNSINNKFLNLNLLKDKVKESITLSKSPDIVKTIDEIQYWGFNFDIELKVPDQAKESSTKKEVKTEVFQ